ncbi:MAG: tetratricopeptide repeat protein [Algibacter sp.]
MMRLTLLFLLVLFKTEAQTSDLNVADSLYVNGNYSKAIEQYKTHENQSEVFDKMAKAYVAIGNYDAALNNYKASIEANPENALIKFEYARLLSKTKKYKAATKVFNDLVYVDYKNPNYHYELGLVLEQLKDSTAQNRFFNAFQLDSTHQKAIYRLAKFHLKKGHTKLVDKYIETGLSSYKNNKELISLKAQSFYAKKQYDKAIIWFEKLVSLHVSSVFIHEKLGNSYSKILDYENGIIHFLKALEFNPKDSNNLYMLGQLYERNNDLINAEKYLSKSLFLQDVALDAEYIQLGKVLNRQNKHKEALDVFKKAVHENPKSDQAYFFLVLTKDQYYKDMDTKIKGYEVFVKKFPKSRLIEFAERRISALKKEDFLKTD